LKHEIALSFGLKKRNDGLLSNKKMSSNDNIREMQHRLVDQEVMMLLKIGEEWYWIQQIARNW
jgi:hypothetical protein